MTRETISARGLEAGAVGEEVEHGTVPDQVPLLAAAAVLLRNLPLIVWPALVCGVLAVVITILSTASYTATSRFLPTTSGASNTGFSSIAAQFGVRLPNSGGGESIQFYSQLLESPTLMREAVLTTYRFEAGDEEEPIDMAGTLVDLFEVEGDTRRKRVRAAIGMLEERVTTETALDAGILTLRTSAPWPELAVQINRRLLELTNQFNLERRQSTAAAERQFIEARLEKERNQLEAAEGELQAFLEQNRAYSASPQLNFEAQRLQRRVTLYQQVYTSLAQAFEQALIEEVRNTPVITVLDVPEGSARGGQPLVFNMIVGIMFGGLAGIMFALFREYLRSEQKRHPAVYSTFLESVGTGFNNLLPPPFRKKGVQVRSL